MPSYEYRDGKPIVREDDGTERDATPSEVLDHFQDRDANQIAFDVVRRATEGR